MVAIHLRIVLYCEGWVLPNSYLPVGKEQKVVLFSWRCMRFSYPFIPTLVSNYSTILINFKGRSLEMPYSEKERKKLAAATAAATNAPAAKTASKKKGPISRKPAQKDKSKLNE